MSDTLSAVVSPCTVIIIIIIIIIIEYYLVWYGILEFNVPLDTV